VVDTDRACGPTPSISCRPHRRSEGLRLAVLMGNGSDQPSQGNGMGMKPQARALSPFSTVGEALDCIALSAR